MLSKHTWLLFFLFCFVFFERCFFYWSYIFLAFPKQSGKPLCWLLLWAEVKSWWLTTTELGSQFIQKWLNESTIIFQCPLKNRFHVGVHLFSNKSHMTSEFYNNKKVAHKMQLSFPCEMAFGIPRNSKDFPRNS